MIESHPLENSCIYQPTNSTKNAPKWVHIWNLFTRLHGIRNHVKSHNHKYPHYETRRSKHFWGRSIHLYWLSALTQAWPFAAGLWGPHEPGFWSRTENWPEVRASITPDYEASNVDRPEKRKQITWASEKVERGVQSAVLNVACFLVQKGREAHKISGVPKGGGQHQKVHFSTTASFCVSWHGLWIFVDDYQKRSSTQHLKLKLHWPIPALFLSHHHNLHQFLVPWTVQVLWVLLSKVSYLEGGQLVRQPNLKSSCTSLHHLFWQLHSSDPW